MRYVRKKGRPTKNEQVLIAQELRSYYERGYNVPFTAEKTGYDVKTVYTHFGVWDEQIKELQEKDFLIQSEKKRNRIILGFENVFFELYESLDEIKEERRKYKKKNKLIPKHLWSTKLEILRIISGLIEKKGSFSMGLSYDKAVEKKIEELIDAKPKQRN